MNRRGQRKGSPSTSSRFKRPRQRFVVLAVLAALFPTTALAAELMAGETVVIAAPVDGDLYLLGYDVLVATSVTGDVIAVGARVVVHGDVGGSVIASGADVIVNGNVGGSVMAIASNVRVEGTVGHAVRAVAFDVDVENTNITGDLVAAARTVEVDAGSRIGGDVHLRTSSARLDSTVSGSIRGRADEWSIGGRVTNAIDVRADTLRFTDAAVIDGPVRYASPHEMVVERGAAVTGPVSHLDRGGRTAADLARRSLVFAVFRYAWAAALGLFLVWVAPESLRSMADTLRQRPLGTIGWGTLAFASVPLLILFLMITVIGFPVGVVVLAGFVLALYASQLVLAIAVGLAIIPARWKLDDQRRETSRAIIVGLALVVLVRSLPIPGWYVVSSILTAIFGLGALAIELYRLRIDRRLWPAR